MSASDTTIGRARNISVLRMEMYLRAKGWFQIGRTGDVARIWRKALPGSQVETLRAPALESVVDYATAIAHVVQVLSATGRQPVEQTLQELEDVFEDVSRWRLPDLTGYALSIGLDEAVAMVNHLRAAYLWGAVAAADRTGGRRVFAPNPPAPAKNLLRSARFGHTEHGSFVFTVRVPVVDLDITPTTDVGVKEGKTVLPAQLDEVEAQTPLFPEAPPEHEFFRKASVQLMQALASAADASRVPSKDQEDAFQASIAHGVSANLLDTIAHLLDTAPTLEVQPAWSPLLPPPSNTPKSVLFTRREQPSIAEAAARFRKQPDESQRRLTGWVHRLERDRSLDVPGTVEIETRLDAKPLRFRTILEPEDYRTAVTAHRNGWIIEVTGTLLKERKSVYMIDPHRFRRADGPMPGEVLPGPGSDQ